MEAPVFTLDAGHTLDSIIAALAPGGPVAVITDSCVQREVLPRLRAESQVAASAPAIVIEAGEEHKNLESLAAVWERMSRLGMTRSSVAVCVGGGVVTDLGGFAAATFKRGIRCVNIPTTLLAQIDASVGGKTGIDFAGLKNEIGAFAVPEAVIIDPRWLDTLPDDQWLSGYGEMVKHSLLSEPAELPPLGELRSMTPEELLNVIRESVAVKQRIVEADPREGGIRAALNLGHTAGHAIESLLIERGKAVTHGSAVAFGVLTALVLSRMLRRMEPGPLYATATLLREAYGAWPLDCEAYPRLIELMRHDKKNLTADSIRFVLLDAPGKPVIGIAVDDADIRAAFDITRDLLGC